MKYTSALFIMFIACAPTSRDNHRDGMGGGIGGTGGMGGGGDVPIDCTPGQNVCYGNDLKECEVTGKSGSVVEHCAACSLGRCTTPACAAVESSHSAMGCIFYGLDTDNTDYDDALVFGFPIGNPGTVPVDVHVERAIGKDSWKDMVSGTVNPGEINYFRLALGPAIGDDYHIEGTGQAFKAYRITSLGPIVVYQVNSDDETGSSSNSGSTLLLPFHDLGQHYFAMTPPDRGMPAGYGHGPDHSFIDVIGIINDTKVTVISKAAVEAGGSILAMAKNEIRSFRLAEGEVLQLETLGAGNDLSGSEITSDHPVVVYAGNVCGGFDPKRLAELHCDHVEETMYPVNTWGTNFVFPDMRIPKSLPSKAVWGRIVASEDGTMVHFDAPRTLAGLPLTTSMNKGDVLAIEITDPFMPSMMPTTRAHFAISADKPIEVEAFMGDDEGGAVVIPVDQFLDDYLVSIHPWFTGYIMVTRKIGTPVMLDGLLLADDLFTLGGAGYEVSFVAMPRCEMGLDKCAHRLTGAHIGITVTANGGSCNYCYAGGAGAKCVNKTAGCL